MAPKYATMGITLRVENETVNYRGIGTTALNPGQRFIDGTLVQTRTSPGRKRRHRYLQPELDEDSHQCAADLRHLCEGNTIRNSSVGFDLDHAYSFAIRGTTYENCPKPVNDHGFGTALLPGAPRPVKTTPCEYCGGAAAQ